MNKGEVLYSAGANNECFTPDYAVRAILPHLLRYPWRYERIWCPFDKPDSQFVIQLEAAGFEVHCSHIDQGQDFFTYTPPVYWDAIVSNPPFTNKAGVFRRALSFGKPLALLMTLTWLNDSGPKRVFTEAQRELQLLMFPERVKFPGHGSKITFSSAYFCSDFLERQIMIDSLKKYGMP